MTGSLPTPSMTRHAAPTFLAASVLALAACAVSQQSEVRIGADYAAQVERQLPLVHDAEIVEFINVLGGSLARVTDDRSLVWHFSVVDSRDLNAFALPGGYIYVNRGIIERATTLAQVAGVIGHEIGHVTRRHGVKQMQKAQGANIGLTLGCVFTNICNSQAAQTGIGIAAGGIFAKFSRNDEAEADEEGVNTLIKAHLDPGGMPEMFRILLDARKERPDQVAAFFASHPLEEERIAATTAIIARQPPASLRGLTRDSPDFQAFKRRMSSLPEPPKK